MNGTTTENKHPFPEDEDMNNNILPVIRRSTYSNETDMPKLPVPGEKRQRRMGRRASMRVQMRRSSLSSQKSISWIKSFAKTDPRWNIMRYFQNVVMQYEVKDNPALLMLRAGNYEFKGEIASSRPAAFSVWRTTSMDAIRLMMTGKGTGKGLDIKGKSALRGKLSGFVPFVQIHNNDEDKKKVGTSLPYTRVRIFFDCENVRDEAYLKLKKVMKEMLFGLKVAQEAMNVAGISDEDYEEALQKMTWKMTNPKVMKVDDYGPEIWGLDIPERLLWEAYIMRGDCTREPGSEMDTGRTSEPQFFFMNISSMRKAEKKPRPVLWQSDSEDPMNPMTLLMAYEENENVIPVVSDFDPFLVGTRGVPFKEPLRSAQVKVLQWCIKEIEGILKDKNTKGNWTQRWLGVLKSATVSGFHPEIPRYGFGDPMSYSIIANAVGNLSKSGAVRHGSECFNFYFPQAMDEEYLIICPEIFGDLPYKYVDQHQLREFLIEQVHSGYTFPLNPKWVLCDPGWIDVWNALHASTFPHVKQSLAVWYPPESGIRERINMVSLAHPEGFLESKLGDSVPEISAQEAKDLALLELKRYQTFQRAKRKLRAVILWMRIARDARAKRIAITESVGKSIQSESETAIPEKKENDVNVKHHSLDVETRDNKGNNLEAESRSIKHHKQKSKRLETKERELKKKEKSLMKLEREMNAKLRMLEKQNEALKMLEEIKAREQELQLKEVSLKVKESQLQMMELEINLKLQKLVAQEKGKGRKKTDKIHMDLREIELWRKQSDLEVKEVELNVRSEKLSAREKEVASEEEYLKRVYHMRNDGNPNGFKLNRVPIGT